MKRVALLILVVVILLLSGCGAPATKPAPVFSKEWSGTGIKTTETFTARAPWAIEWEFTCDKMGDTDVGLFQIAVYKKGSDFPVAAAGNIANQSGSDISYVQQSGTFYLVINSFSGNWKVRAFSN